jgi:CheY-like chemotaxis protein
MNNNNESAPLIILADDDPSIRLILHHILQRDGYRVLDATNGREVLRLHQDNHVDLVLLDAIMPEQDGFVTCRILKEQQPELPVLMITGLDDDTSVEHAFRVGADDYISKPINWSVLKHRIARTLSLISPRNALDECIFDNQIKIHYSPRINLSNETVTAIEVRADLPAASRPGIHAMEHLLNSFCQGYLLAKQQYPTANILSLPLWPVRTAGNTLIEALNGLEKKFGIPLFQVQLRIHECYSDSETLLRALPSTLPVQLCIDEFSFSVRNLDLVNQHSHQSLMINMATTRQLLENKTGWLNDAVELYKSKGIILHACGVCEPEDLQLSISLGCTSASGPAIQAK